MEVGKLLVGNDIGRLRLFMIGFVIAMGISMDNFYKKKPEEYAHNAK